MRIFEGDRVVLKSGLEGYVNNRIIHVDVVSGREEHRKELHILTYTGVLQKGVSYSEVVSINGQVVGDN